MVLLFSMCAVKPYPSRISKGAEVRSINVMKNEEKKKKTWVNYHKSWKRMMAETTDEAEGH